MSTTCCVKQFSDEMYCVKCNLRWDTNDSNPPKCLIVAEPVEDYKDLKRILQTAFDQSAKGKGKERHANEKPFDKQPIMEIARMVGVGGHTYQICKKAQESVGMVERKQFEAAKAELRGAIVYAAAAILLVEELENKS